MIGTVGSGKTTLLLSLLGEISPNIGELALKGQNKIAYLAQSPFIQAGTIRENILFGQNYVA